MQPANGHEFELLEHLVMNHAGTVSGCICVMLDWDETRKRFIEKLRSYGLPVLVLVIRTLGDKRPLDPGPMADAPDQFLALEVGRIEEQLARLK